MALVFCQLLFNLLDDRTDVATLEHFGHPCDRTTRETQGGLSTSSILLSQSAWLRARLSPVASPSVTSCLVIGVLPGCVATIGIIAAILVLHLSAARDRVAVVVVGKTEEMSEVEETVGAAASDRGHPTVPAHAVRGIGPRSSCMAGAVENRPGSNM